jgi:hypothetical protein
MPTGEPLSTVRTLLRRIHRQISHATEADDPAEDDHRAVPPSPEEIVMRHDTDKIEHLEGSIAHVQGVLDNAQQVLGVAERAEANAESIASTARRMALAGLLVSIVVAVVLLARRRQ